MKRRFYTIITGVLLLSLTACSGAAVSSSTAPQPESRTSIPETTAPSTTTSSEASEDLTVRYGEYMELAVSPDTDVIVFGSDEVSFQVTSTLLVRNDNALLIDTKFNKTDAGEIINYLNDNNITLTQIFISHGDPDYYFGLEEFRAAYPDAIVRTTPQTAEHIAATMAGKVEVWAEALGNEVPVALVVPEAYAESSFDFEGLNIQIFGSDPLRTTLYIPDLSLLVGGANITSDNHLFLADMSTPADRQQWMGNLIELRDLNAQFVIPGHTNLATETFDRQAIDFSIEYLAAVEEVLPTVQTSAEFIAAMEERFPGLNSAAVLGLSGGVLMGEMEWRRYADN